MLRQVVKILGGDPNKRTIEAYSEVVEQINALEGDFEALTDEQLAAKTEEFRRRLAEGETLDDILPEAFAAVREASKRAIGLRHYDVQLIGGIALHEGKIAEMRTGEGKTLAATLPLYLNALEGKGAHLVTVNDYLARRDARWMAPIYDLLGLSVGVLQMAARTEGGRKGFVVDLEREHSQEDQDQLVMVHRREAYAADITYGTNNEFGFDYLRDNMTMRIEDRVQRGHHYAIIDEVDNVLIDEARTPLIISGPSHDDAENYQRMAGIVKRLRPEDYEVNERDRNVVLTEIGEAHVEEMLGVPLRDPDRPEDITPEQARLLGYLEQALRAQYLYHRNKEYLVQAGKVVIIDEFTGRLMPGRRWSDGLHQAVEAKEGVKVQSENITYATITIQNYFRMYEKLAGMTGTAVTEAEEFDKIYGLDVIALPSNVEFIASLPDSNLEALEDRDEYSYKYTYYAASDDPDKKPVFFKRKDYPDVVYRSQEAKLRALTTEIIQYHVVGRPILVGTTSVENSDQLSSRLRADAVGQLLQTLLLRRVWMEAHNRGEDGRLIIELSFLNEPLDKLKASEMRALGRELGITLNLKEDENMTRLLRALDLDESYSQRLSAVIDGGIPHQVLNARKHTEESQIIAGAGGFGAVTIATNMAGRGVDIKLGGEIAEEVISAVNRVLRRTGHEKAFDMSMEERLQALEALDPEDYGIYDAEIKYFKRSMEEMSKVKELGGLHVIGSERHEARRIDNQLRGRSARQGDPGSSRFYLSMEDNLMRLFGGQQVDLLMQRLGMDDSVPLEHNLVGRIIEQSQTRVEGAHFDTRKHLLEYDDVLNSQREKIYAQRDRIFSKDDLYEDVREMLETEVTERVPQALEDQEGPWRLLAWLEQIQPSFAFGGVFFPSFSYRLLLDHLKEQGLTTTDEAQAALLDIAQASIEVEKEHTLQAVSSVLARTGEALEAQLDERSETLLAFLDEVAYRDEEQSVSPSELLQELTSALQVPIKLSNAQQRLLLDDPEQASDLIEGQIEDYLLKQVIGRTLGMVARRVPEGIELTLNDLAGQSWEQASERILAEIEGLYEKRLQLYIGEQRDGQIARDLQSALEKVSGGINDATLANMLILMTQGTVTTFDKKTHQRVQQRSIRLTYVYYAAQFLEDQEPKQITKQVLAHLGAAQGAVQQIWGISEWNRLADKSWDELDSTTHNNLTRELDETALQLLREGKQKLGQLGGEARQAVVKTLGSQALTALYRQLLLRVISDLWIDYLTRMEALRIAIGLEAYAQRDPLVEYKGRAFQMFQQLFRDMRLSVVSRMFTFRPQGAAAPSAPQGGQPQRSQPKSKRKRRRRRR